MRSNNYHWFAKWNVSFSSYLRSITLKKNPLAPYGISIIFFFCFLVTVKHKAKKVSKKWIQILLNDNPEILNRCIDAEDIQWLSPIVAYDYLEYNNGKLINKLGITLKYGNLHNFLPRVGQTLDAIGKISSGAF